jgi:RNA polymerase sigma-70 factor (ECF subfamily)
MTDTEPETSGTLLNRLHAWQDHTAWQRFFAAYNPLLTRWARTSLRNPADVQDLTQLLWCELARRLRSFEYDSTRSFRGWLRTLYRSRLSDFQKSESRRRSREASVARPLSEGSETAADNPAELSEQSVAQARQLQHMHRIQQQVRQKVTPKTWAVFEQIALHGMEIGEVARQHRMRYAAAFAAFSRVQRMLRQSSTAETSE